ncbi:MAG: KdsC family phosphatase [Pseudomonadota bacterium]|jgi:3-deoxy-D-manno-octulosonate 8-phosphate phosphatase (KDO 8-P phosphatase)
MPYNHLADLPAPIRERAANIRLAAFDVDGVMTDGRLGFDADGIESKQFHVLDGFGLKMLRDHGVTVAIITARSSGVVAARAAELGIAEVHQGQKDKLGCLQAIAGRLGLSLDQVSYMGDDLPDLGCLLRAGLSCAPPNAHPWVRERVHWRTQLAGGRGAVRELCDLIVAAQGGAAAVLARWTPA